MPLPTPRPWLSSPRLPDGRAILSTYPRTMRVRPNLRQIWFRPPSSLQPVVDLGNASVGAGFVLVAAGGAADPDAADRLLVGIDRHAATLDRQVGVELQRVERARHRDPLVQLAGGDPPQRRGVGLARSERPAGRAGAV